MVRALELRVGLGARAPLQHLIQRFVGHERINERAIEPLRHTPQRRKRQGVFSLILFDAGDAGLGDTDPHPELCGGHAQGLADSLDPAARRARELWRLAQRGKTALKLLASEALGGNGRRHMF